MDFTVESLFPKTTKLITELSKANADGILPRVQTISPLVHDIGEKDVYIYFTYANRAKETFSSLVDLIEEKSNPPTTQKEHSVVTPVNFVFYFEPCYVGGIMVPYTTFLIDLLELKEKGIFDFTYSVEPIHQNPKDDDSGSCSEYLIASAALASGLIAAKNAYEAGKNNR